MAKFKKYNANVMGHLQEVYSDHFEFDFADLCAIALSKGTNPTDVYLNHYKTFLVHGGTKQRSSEIFMEVMHYMKEV